MSNDVFLSPKQNLTDCRGTLQNIQDWKSKNWAIGMSYSGTHQPDGFFTFFAQRGLGCASYLAAPDLATGDPSAYDKNMATLTTYAQGVYDAEVKAVDSTIASIKDWQNKFWAIGLTYSSCQPDGFARFFSLRGLNIAYFVAGGACSYGDQSAYDKNIATLESYKASLWNPSS